MVMLTITIQLFRCLSNKECRGYQYKETKETNCILIIRSCAGTDGQVFQQNDNSDIYEKGLLLEGKINIKMLYIG